MTPSRTQLHFDDDIPLELAIQRCVDGELDDTCERALFSRLELQPAGWRQLALAFAENRLLGTVCRNHLAASRSALTSVFPGRNGRSRLRDGFRWLAMSMVCTLAFAAGRQWPVGMRTPSDRETVARNEITSPGSQSIVLTPAPGQPPGATVDPPLQPVVKNERQPVMFVNLSLPDAAQGLPVPVYAVPEDVSAWQPFREPSLSTGQAERLRKAGYQVNTSRHILQVPSPQGDRIMLPVESVNILPARY